ncbi:hypothetical protein [Priestia megaterium]|uniref:hypothetical protein n=1 Tax=Priestia megaterium TaxID=1404 RepID=UPI002E1A0B14|nr:hypothetical protein [Priestia megaterium]
MKFEAKHLIRWGIPGWVFLMWLLFAFGIINPLLFKNLLLKDLIKSLGILVTLASIGVPIGYVISQFYFSTNWVIGKNLDMSSVTKKVKNFPYPENWEQLDKKEEYFFIEYLWQSQLSKMSVEKRDYIAGRYSHFLRTIHGIGTLLYSSGFSFLIFIILMIKVKVDPYYFLLVLFQLVFIILTYINYQYYSKNLKSFQGYFLNEFINLKEENNNEEENNDETPSI